MYALRRISDTIQNVITPSSPNTRTIRCQTSSPRNCIQDEPQFPDEPIGCTALSPVDELIARSLEYESENWDIDVSDIVQSIEIVGDDIQLGTNGANEEDEEDTWNKPRNRIDIGDIDKTLDIRGKYRQQLDDAKRLGELGWSTDTILAYLKIARRGYEPILPPSWKRDFPKFPPMLFGQDEESAFIKPLQKSNFAAIQAFDKFCSMGQSVRQSEHHHTWVGRSPENMIKKHLEDYLKWAWKDAGLNIDIEHERIPCLIEVVKRPDRRRSEETIQNPEHFAEMEAKTKAKLKTVGDHLLALLQMEEEEEGLPDFIIEPPTLFGLVIFDTLVALVAYEPLTDQMRAFAFYHFNKMHEEVWNCISLAILISWVRNSMLRIKAALLEKGILMEDIEPTPQPDPDA